MLKTQPCRPQSDTHPSYHCCTRWGYPVFPQGVNRQPISCPRRRRQSEQRGRWRRRLQAQFWHSHPYQEDLGPGVRQRGAWWVASDWPTQSIVHHWRLLNIIIIISALAGILLKSQEFYFFCSVQFLSWYWKILIICSAVTVSMGNKFLKLPTTIQF